METSDSDSDADDALQADLLNLRRALGSAYRSVSPRLPCSHVNFVPWSLSAACAQVEENAQPQSSTPAAASAQVQVLLLLSAVLSYAVITVILFQQQQQAYCRVQRMKPGHTRLVWTTQS